MEFTKKFEGVISRNCNFFVYIRHNMNQDIV